MKKIFNEFTILLYILTNLFFVGCGLGEEEPRKIDIPKLEHQLLFDQAKKMSLTATVNPSDIKLLKDKFNTLKVNAKKIGYLAGLSDDKKNTFLHLLLKIRAHNECKEIIKEYLLKLSEISAAKTKEQLIAVAENKTPMDIALTITDSPTDRSGSEILAALIGSGIDPNEIKIGKSFDAEKFNEVLPKVDKDKRISIYEKLSDSNKISWQKKAIEKQSFSTFKSIYENIADDEKKKLLRSGILENYYPEKLMNFIDDAEKWGLLEDLRNPSSTFKLKKVDESGDYEGNFLYVFIKKMTEKGNLEIKDMKAIHNISLKLKEKIANEETYKSYYSKNTDGSDDSVIDLLKDYNEAVKKYMLNQVSDVQINDLNEEMDIEIFSWIYEKIKADDKKFETLQASDDPNLLAILAKKTIDEKVYKIIEEFIALIGDERAKILIKNSNILGTLSDNRTGKNDTQLVESIILLLNKADKFGIRPAKSDKQIIKILDILKDEKEFELLKKVFSVWVNKSKDCRAENVLISWSLENGEIDGFSVPNLVSEFYTISKKKTGSKLEVEKHQICIKNALVKKAYEKGEPAEALNRVALMLEKDFLPAEAIKGDGFTVFGNKDNTGLLRILLLKYVNDKQILTKEIVQKIAGVIKIKGVYSNDEWIKHIGQWDVGWLSIKVISDKTSMGVLQKVKPELSEKEAKEWLNPPL